MARALDGVNLLEFGSHPGAAYAAMLLAEQGADAIKVEQPAGDPARGTAHFHVLNRSKRSVFLDLASKPGASEAQKLIRWADVVVTGWTSERLRSLGFDYSSIRKINPRAVFLTMPPLGSRGPDAELDCDEDFVQARGGIAGSQWTRSGDPSPLTFPAASYSAGLMAAIAAVGALIAREALGGGQQVEVSLLAGAFSLQTGSIMRHEKMTALYARAARDPLGPIPCYRLFEAGDGRYLFIACGNATFWNKFALVIERPELVANPRFEGAPWGIPPDNWQTLKDVLEPIIRTRPRDEWLRRLREYDVPCAPVMSRHDFIDDVQVRALAMRREIDDPTLGRTVQMGVPVTLNDTPGEIIGAAPKLTAGKSTELPIVETASRARHGEVARRRARKPLEGVLVLDFASYIAGSYGPMILAQMGADVIKIESLSGDAFRNFGFGFLGWNQGKRSIALDLDTPDGREIVHALANKADVVVENLRPGRMARFSLGFDELSRMNPRIIYMSVNGFGNRGPEYNQPGFDPLLQARSGVMAAQGGHHGHPVYLTCAICDYGAAMLSALGCVLALYARERTGRGQLCETSLLQAAMATQAGEFIFYDGRPDMENGDAEYRGRSALARCYRCRDDAWLYISITSESQWNSVRKMCASVADVDFLSAAREPNDGALASKLSDWFASLDRTNALQALADAAVPVSPVNRIPDLFRDPQIIANELVVELEHSQWGSVIQTGVLTKFSTTPTRPTRSAPLLGEHTDEILSRYLGYDATKIAELRARRIVK
jgi:crotonobetainyl-CoA:carnitine CoA-transferase CaiB-like acyl-CoA transferase